MNNFSQKYEIDLQPVRTQSELHDLLQKILPLPDYYGRNLDSLYDVLMDIGDNAQITFVNSDFGEEALGKYYKNLNRMCNDINNNNPFVKIIFQ